MNGQLLQLLGIFSLLSILSIGGGTAVLPEMREMTVVQEKWLTDVEFRDVYSIGQIAPGPNMLMVIVLGYKVSGYAGAAVAFLGFFLPCCLIAWGTCRVWNHFEGSPWRLAVQRGLAPLVVGLMAAGMVAIARTAIVGFETTVLAVIVFAALYFGKKVNPALLIFGGGLCGWLFMR
jgi:chromate transporter